MKGALLERSADACATAVAAASASDELMTTVATAKSSLGRILVDGSGRTVYLFESDRRGGSACTVSAGGMKVERGRS